MKRILSVLCAAIFFVGVIGAQSGNLKSSDMSAGVQETTGSGDEEQDEINSQEDVYKNYPRITFWTFNDDILKATENPVILNSIRIYIENVKFEYPEFNTELEKQFNSGSTTPDVFLLEEGNIRTFVGQKTDNLLDLTDLYDEIKGKLFSYPQKMATKDGRVYAIGWQVTPGAIYYRKSLARKYLKTDDPEKVQEFFSDWDKYLETAKILRVKSKGRCYVNASSSDIDVPFSFARKGPWIVDGEVCIDPDLEKQMDVARALVRRNYTPNYEMWGDFWFEGMSGRLIDSTDQPIEIFCYFFPNWGSYMLKGIAPETEGDWGVIQGPQAYNWGGTWFAVNKNSEKPEEAKQFIRFMCADDDFSGLWIKFSGDLISNKDMAKDFSNYQENADFMKGISSSDFIQFIDSVNVVECGEFDKELNELWALAVKKYAGDEMPRSEAIEWFKKNAASLLERRTDK